MNLESIVKYGPAPPKLEPLCKYAGSDYFKKPEPEKKSVNSDPGFPHDVQYWQERAPA